MCPIITQFTGVTDTFSTIIDHVITNCNLNSIPPKIIKSSLSDHYPVFCSTNYQLHFMKNLNPETFVTDISNNLDHFGFSAPFSDICKLSAFDNFIEITKTTINAHSYSKNCI